MRFRTRNLKKESKYDTKCLFFFTESLVMLYYVMNQQILIEKLV